MTITSDPIDAAEVEEEAEIIESVLAGVPDETSDMTIDADPSGRDGGHALAASTRRADERGYICGHSWARRPDWNSP